MKSLSLALISSLGFRITHALNSRSKHTKLCSDILQRSIEKDLISGGYEFIIGVDEAGRGPLAGPVVISSVISRDIGLINVKVKDSKLLTAQVREEIYADIIHNDNYIINIDIVDNTKIDEINILQATLLGMSNSIKNIVSDLNIEKCYAIIDGNKTPADLPIVSRALVKGDSLVYPVALASIVAKVTRDRIMSEYDLTYPNYGFAKHKGFSYYYFLILIFILLLIKH